VPPPDDLLSFHLNPRFKPQRLDTVVAEWLRSAGKDVSRSTVRQWIEDGRVRVDGIPAKPSSRPRPGARVDVEPAPPPPSKAEPDPSVPVDRLFQDDHIVVVNKPANLVVHPARGHYTGTLVHGLLALDCFDPSLWEDQEPDAVLRPGIVHRLDKDTSGVMVVARTRRAREKLALLFARHDIDRVYEAVVVGAAQDATYDTPYGRHPVNRLKFTSRLDASDKRAVTHVTVEETLAKGRATRVTCRLQTGRTHQIRVHLSERSGTPVLGDALYGPKPADRELRALGVALQRHFLHAGVLGFAHPVTGERVRFTAPRPADLQRTLDDLRAMGTNNG